MKKKVLLTTVHRPFGIESESCTKNISAEVYHAQVTLAQGPFSIRVYCTGWGLEFIALNLQTATTVLHYPTKKAFIKELKKGYDYIGISFVICTFPKAKELCSLVRQHSPHSQIVLGGYGTVLEECDRYADYVCREEGVNYLKRLLGEDRITEFKIPLIERPVKIMSFKSGRETIIPTGLGCSRGCDFCCTSHFFNQRYFPLIETGREIHKVMSSVKSDKFSFRNVGIVDEDFLDDRKKIMEMAHLNAFKIDEPVLFTCFASLKSLSQYTPDEFLSMGLSGVWIGIESKKAEYPKLKNLDAAKMIALLKSLGINVLTSMIIGYDWHNEKTVEEDFQYLLSLKPTLSQLLLYSPCPQTPLYERLRKENRLLNIPFIFHDGFHALFKHPHFSPEELEVLLMRLFQREFEELGPSIFRILEVQIMGYEKLRTSSHPLLVSRAEIHKRFCLEIYPLLKTGIKKAPTQKVREYLADLKDRVESQLRIPKSKKIQAHFVPLLYSFTKLRDRIHVLQQPPFEKNHYNFP